jgi:hypothetical protein
VTWLSAGLTAAILVAAVFVFCLILGAREARGHTDRVLEILFAWLKTEFRAPRRLAWVPG